MEEFVTIISGVIGIAFLVLFIIMLSNIVEIKNAILNRNFSDGLTGLKYKCPKCSKQFRNMWKKCPHCGAEQSYGGRPGKVE